MIIFLKGVFTAMLLVVGISLGLGLTWTSPSVAKSCKRPGKTDIRINLDKQRVAYNFDLDSQQLARLNDSVGMENLETILGLHAPEFDWDRRAWTRRNKDGSCLSVAKIEIEIKVERNVYVSRDLKRGSCHYNVTLRHEERHVRFDDGLLNKLAKNMHQLLATRVNNRIFASLKSLYKVIDGTMIEAHEGYLKERKRAHKTIDNDTNYRREWSLCK
ncbi:MAG: hypothetical protein ACPGO3_08415 [Magnetospiraceae bacterium]